MSDPTKYEKAREPKSNKEAIRMAEEREEWAKAARENDRHGTAKELELTALLLRYWTKW